MRSRNSNCVHNRNIYIINESNMKFLCLIYAYNFSLRHFALRKTFSELVWDAPRSTHEVSAVIAVRIQPKVKCVDKFGWRSPV
jgi:hypothetical protein